MGVVDSEGTKPVQRDGRLLPPSRKVGYTIQLSAVPPTLRVGKVDTPSFFLAPQGRDLGFETGIAILLMDYMMA